MKLEKPSLYKGVFNHFKDERGFLNHLDINKLTKQIGLPSFSPTLQLMSFSQFSNTFRGFHFQTEPYLQSKLLILHSGEILDFIVPFKKPLENGVKKFDMVAGDILFIPNTYAHGFLTKSSNVSIQYLIDNDFNIESYKGINGTKFIKKFIGKSKLFISQKDLNFEDYLD